MRIRIPLPGRSLRIKTYRHLRSEERDGRYPTRKLGPLYFIWRRS
jgi:hypothetical protein